MPSWKAGAASVVGTSHEATGLPCQDHHAYAELKGRKGSVLVAAVADGAGSAARADEGARLVCEQFLIEVQDALDGLESIDDFDGEHLASCWSTTRLTLADHAATEEVDLAQFACTFLTVVVLPHRLLAAQIGDGAIVMRHEGAYRVAIWPQQGEFANTTNFLTGESWEHQREMIDFESPCDAIVMFTDGLQQLILRYMSRDVEERFVTPLVLTLADCEVVTQFEADLQAFLSSPRVNGRTDDDKTLLVAALVE